MMVRGLEKTPFHFSKNTKKSAPCQQQRAGSKQSKTCGKNTRRITYNGNTTAFEHDKVLSAGETPQAHSTECRDQERDRCTRFDSPAGLSAPAGTRSSVVEFIITSCTVIEFHVTPPIAFGCNFKRRRERWTRTSRSTECWKRPASVCSYSAFRWCQPTIT